MLASYRKSLPATFVVVFLLALAFQAYAQSGGNSTSVTRHGPLPPLRSAFAAVEIHNPVSHFDRATATDSSGKLTIPNVPFNPYHLAVLGRGFAPYSQDIDVRSVVPMNLNIALKVGGTSESVTVEAGADLVENDPTGHSDVDRDLFNKLPLESPPRD